MSDSKIIETISDLSHLQEQLASITDSNLNSVFEYIKSTINSDYLDSSIQLIAKYSQIRFKSITRNAKLCNLLIQHYQSNALEQIFKFADPHLLRNIFDIKGFTFDDIMKTELNTNILIAFAPELNAFSQIRNLLFRVPYSRLLELKADNWKKYIEILLNRYETNTICHAIFKDDIDKLKQFKEFDKQYYIDEFSFNDDMKIPLLTFAKFYNATKCYDYLISKGLTPDETTTEYLIRSGRFELIKESEITKFAQAALDYHQDHDLVTQNVTLEQCVCAQNYVVFLQKLATKNEISKTCFEIAASSRYHAFCELFVIRGVYADSDILDILKEKKMEIIKGAGDLLKFRGKSIAAPYSTEQPNPMNNKCCRILLVVFLVVLILMIMLLVYILKYTTNFGVELPAAIAKFFSRRHYH